MKHLILAFAIVTGTAFAETVKDDNCKVPQSATGIEMESLMDKEMRIDTSTIDEEKTKTELISNIAVSDLMAQQYAIADFNGDPNDWLKLKDFKNIYSQDNVRNLIIKFTYENKQKKQNIYLVSAFSNDYECDVRFNGYIIVKREF